MHESAELRHGCVRWSRRERPLELIPQRHVRGLLLGVAAQPIGVLGGGGVGRRAVGRAQRRVCERADCVAVLAGVARELAGAQLASAPALVERVLEHVDRAAGFVESGQNVHGRVPFLLVLVVGAGRKLPPAQKATELAWSSSAAHWTAVRPVCEGPHGS